MSARRPNGRNLLKSRLCGISGDGYEGLCGIPGLRNEENGQFSRDFASDLS